MANGVGMLQIRDPCVGYTGADIRALMPELGTRVGIAVTARMDAMTAGTDRPASLFRDWARLLQETAHGDDGEVLPVFAVMEAVGPRPKYVVTIGDMMGTMMTMAGAVAFLTNGSIRDLEGVRAVPLPCWAVGLSPMHGRLRWLDVGSPVVIDGMTARTGDVIHADVNGALVIPPEAAPEAYDKALAVREREDTAFGKMRAPDMTFDKYLRSR